MIAIHGLAFFIANEVAFNDHAVLFIGLESRPRKEQCSIYQLVRLRRRYPFKFPPNGAWRREDNTGYYFGFNFTPTSPLRPLGQGSLQIA